MKYSQSIGLVAVLLLITTCFFPWSFIVSQQITVTGMHAEGTTYGKPGLLNIFFSIIMLLLFSLPKIWAKRTNVLIAALNFAWSVRNYILLSTCMMGECPEKKIALILSLILSGIILLMALLPKVAVSH
jgi:hypothetical protein